MAKGKRGHEEVETYESDGGFISNDDGNAPKSKKSKKVAAKAKDKTESMFWEVSCSSNVHFYMGSNKTSAFVFQDSSKS
jgi:hypothetical protein